MPGKRGTTLRQVASQCGVSLSTVDRVINGRGSVRPDTGRRVLQAARQLGLDRMMAFQSPPRLRFHVLLLGETNQFYQRLSEHFLASARMLGRDRVTCYRIHMEDLSAERVAQTIEHTAEISDGVVVVAYDHPVIRRAINRAAEQVPVVTLLSDVPGARRVSYVGTNNYKAGRVAGELMARFLGDAGGEVLIISGMERFTGHRQRQRGFEDASRIHGSGITIVGETETGEQGQRTADITSGFLKRYPNLRGIYSISVGNTGISDALNAAGRSHHVVLIGHEATNEHIELLRAGKMDAVLDQHPLDEAMQALKILLFHHHCLDQKPAQSYTPVSVLLREST